MLASPRMLKPMNRRPSRGRRRNDLLVTSAVVFLGVLVFACVGMVIPPMRAAIVDLWQYRPEAQHCSLLKDTKARQGCDQREEDVERAATENAAGEPR